MQEATQALAMILQRFTLDDYTHYQLKLRQTGAIKPLDFHIKVLPRTNRPASITVPAPHGNGHQPMGAVTAAQPAGGTTQHNAPLLVLFGSNLGTAENLAHRIADDGTVRGFASTVAPLDDDVGKLPTQGALVVVTSSYNGTPTDNAVKFCAWLQDASTAPHALDGVHYAVFGCGDSNWTATFQAIPKLVDTQLAAHGAQRFYRRGEGDASGDFDGQFQAWYGTLWPAMTKALGLDVAAAATSAAVGAPLYTLEMVTAPDTNRYATTFGAKPLPILVNRELHALNGGSSLERSCRHVEMALDEGMTYRTGDHLAVIPFNPIPVVERVLARFGVARDAFYRIHRAVPGTTQLPLDTPVPVLGLLARFVELQDVATRGQIKRLADYDDRPAEKQELLALADDPRYTSDILAKRVSLLNLLDEFPACALPFNVFLEWVNPLRPRFYSISSAPQVDPKRCAITVSVVEGPARSGQGTYEGAASTYLQAQPVGSVVYSYVRGPQMPFAPPEDASLPIIMVGPGTGFAPFRGFLEERETQKAKGVQVGPSLLFYGCRDDADFIYKDEMQRWMDEGVTTAYTAYSRRPTQPKQYVQDQIKAHADEVWDLIQRGAVIYVCGDASRMEPDVRRAFANIYQTKTGADAQAADAWFAQLQKDNRYLADVWAGG
jgi:cytochrome P450/NADPH-cytochrome P450 reductase